MAYVLTMPITPMMGYPGRGMGDAAQTAQTVQVAGTMAAGTATGILSSLAASSAAAGGEAAVLGISAAAIPVIGAALVAAVMVATYLIKNSGCGITCVETSSWANQAGAALDNIIAAYFALPAPRTRAQQAVSIAAFDAVWAQLQASCGQYGTGNAGVRCISDRQAGACHWKALPPKWPGEPATGACWNWFNAYRDPIANDAVVPDPDPLSATSVSGTLDSIFGTSTGSTGSSTLLPLALIAGLVLLAVTA